MTLAEMNFILPDLRIASAEIFLLAMICLVLIVDLFVKDTKRTLTYMLTQATLLVTLVILCQRIFVQPQITFSGMFIRDFMGDVLKLALLPIVMLVLAYSRAYLQERPQMARGEYFVLALLATLGMMVMISANNFMAIYVGLELMSLSLYTMVAFNRDSIPATEAAMKYFVLGALASGMLLYGMSMVYGATGSLDIAVISKIVALPEFARAGMSWALLLGVVFLVAGLAFKLGVVPFHMWIPDVYHGSPTVVTLFIGTAPKLAAFAIVMRILVSALMPVAAQWQIMLLFLAVLSMLVGNFAALTQTNIKRMLAYSAISHMGFMLLGLAIGFSSGDVSIALDAYSASMFYILTYVLTSAGTFGMILLLANGGLESDMISDFAGLNKRNPWFAALMMMMMFSLAGIPFFVGFIAKFSILQAIVASGYVWLAIIAVFFSLVGAYYYLRVVKVMYFDAPTNTAPIVAPVSMKLLLSMNGLAVAVLGIIFQDELMWLCRNSLEFSL